MSDIWYKCDICGRFIALQEFVNKAASRNLVTPDAYGSVETWETHHNDCAPREQENSDG